MKAFAIWLLLALLSWIAIGHIIYQIRNPDMTEMRRFLNTKDALFFRK